MTSHAGELNAAVLRPSQTVDYIERKKEKEAEEKRRKDEEQRKAAEASKFDNLPPEKQRELKERVRGARYSSTG